MKSIVEFDTAIGTSNLGDEIILQCLENELGFLLDESFIMRFGTHVKNLDLKKYLFGSQKLQFAYEADFKIIMGTNLLSRDIKGTQAQWPIGGLDSWLYKDCIMAGVGTTLGEGTTTKYSKKIYNRILRKDFYHSVRDEESKKLLEDMGFKAINTGCPTLWKFTPEFCKQIPTKKSNKVIFSLSGYKAQRNRKNDKALIDILRENYDEIIFWCQTSRDELYLDTFENVEDIPRIYSLEKYAQILDEGNVDYVGTRLHGGVYAMQHKVRSIIISIDHRARGFHDTNNLVICERDEINEKLADMINGEIVTDIKLMQENIDFWKEQFLKDYPEKEQKTHEDLLWIKALRFPIKFRKYFKKKLKHIKSALGKKRSKIKKVVKRRLRKLKTFLGKIKKKLKKLVRKVKRYRHDKYIRNSYSKQMLKNPVEKGKIMFFTFQGDYTCNLKYISEEIIRRNLPWKQVWVTFKNPDNNKEEFPEDAKVVKFNSVEYYNELSRSQIWIDNAFNFPKGYINKKDGQTYVQTMHGSLGLKKIGPDVVDDEKRNERGFLCGKLTDVCISNSSFETMVYDTSFWSKDKVVEIGHARNDIFFIGEEKRAEIRNKVCEYFQVEDNTKIALFAPTFRNAKEAVQYEKIDFARVRDALVERFGGEWIILNRAHHSSTRKKKSKKRSFVKNANNYPDIQELMIAIDMGITDYSSWICDYVLTRKPGILYTPDFDSYDYNRGFYYPLEETPFPICKTNDELVNEILKFDENLYNERVDKFLQDRGCIDDGKASEHIVDYLEKIVEGK